MPGPVVIVPYNPSWPRVYEEESKLIRGAVGGIVLSLEHVGSTSVQASGRSQSSISSPA